MFFITDDCDYDDGIRFATLDEAREARRALLSDDLGWHMQDHVHVAEADTKNLMPEPGCWLVVTEDGEGMMFQVDDWEGDKVWERWHRGEFEDKPLLVENYEWV